MNSSAPICPIDTVASLHIFRALAIKEHSGGIFKPFNQEHLLYAVIYNQLSANQFVVDLNLRVRQQSLQFQN
jgi:hypothetical protein